MRPTAAVLTAVLALGAVVRMPAGAREDVNVTGAWVVTITKGSGTASGLAILSQDGATVTGMIGPAETDMSPPKGPSKGTS
jgi:hypothetical protein